MPSKIKANVAPVGASRLLAHWKQQFGFEMFIKVFSEQELVLQH